MRGPKMTQQQGQNAATNDVGFQDRQGAGIASDGGPLEAKHDGLKKVGKEDGKQNEDKRAAHLVDEPRDDDEDEDRRQRARCPAVENRHVFCRM